LFPYQRQGLSILYIPRTGQALGSPAVPYSDKPPFY